MNDNTENIVPPPSPTPILPPSTSTTLRPQQTRKGSLFYHININGIRNKFTEICNFLQSNTLTLFACTESRLDPHSVPLNMFSVPNYHMIRVDRDNNIKKCGGGLIVYVSEIFKYETIDCQVKFPNLVEVLLIKVYRQFIKPVIVIIIYRNPESSKSKFLESFIELQVFLSQFEYEKIFMGDFNYNLLHYLNNFDVDTHKLYLMCKSFNLWQMISGPTFQGKSLLDHIYVTDKRNYVSAGHFSFGGSDHDLCYIERKLGKIKVPPLYCLVRSVKNIKWTDFGKHVLDFNFNLSNNELSTDREVIRFNNHVMNKLDSITPLRQRLLKRRRCPWFSNEIKLLCNNRNKLREDAKVNGDWKPYRIARNNVAYELAKSKKEYFNEKFRKKLKSETLWDTIDELTNFRKQKCTDIVSILDNNNTPVTDKVQINYILADKLFIKPETPPDRDSTRNFIRTYNFDNDNNETLTVTSDDIGQMISETKNKNKNDNKYVPVWIMKKCTSSFCIQLAILFTHLLNIIYVPTQFRSSVVIPLYKGKGARNIPKSYRPIVLLNSYSKIFERFLYHRMIDRIECNLINEQHAYRPDRSCHSALEQFTTCI